MADAPENWLNPHPMHQYMPIPTVPPPPPPHRPMYVNCTLPIIREQYQTVMTTRRQLQPALPPPPYPPALPPNQYPPALPPHQYPPAPQPRPPPPTVNSVPQENVLPRWNVPPIRRQMLPAMQPPPRPYRPALQQHPELWWLENWIPNNETTVQIRNIPFYYNLEWMIQFLDKICLQENVYGENNHVFAYDFLYFPYDTRMNRIRGFAFVNFTDTRSLWKFIWSFSNGVKLFPGSERSVELEISYIQGKNALLNIYRYDPEGICFYPPRNGY